MPWLTHPTATSFDHPLGRLRSGAVVLLYISLGPIVWGIHLTIVYGAHTLLYDKGITGSVLGAKIPTLTVASLTVVALVMLVIAMIAPRMSQPAPTPKAPVPYHAFAQSVMTLLASLSTLGVALAGVTALFLPPCVSLR
jgi:hypothetical protein